MSRFSDFLNGLLNRAIDKTCDAMTKLVPEEPPQIINAPHEIEHNSPALTAVLEEEESEPVPFALQQPPEPPEVPDVVYNDNEETSRNIENMWAGVPSFSGFVGDSPLSAAAYMPAWQTPPTTGASFVQGMYPERIQVYGPLLTEAETALEKIRAAIEATGHTGFAVKTTDIHASLTYNDRCIADALGEINIHAPTGEITIQLKNFDDDLVKRTADMIIAICDNLDATDKRNENLRNKLKILSE